MVNKKTYWLAPQLCFSIPNVTMVMNTLVAINTKGETNGIVIGGETKKDKRKATGAAQKIWSLFAPETTKTTATIHQNSVSTAVPHCGGTPEATERRQP